MSEVRDEGPDGRRTTIDADHRPSDLRSSATLARLGRMATTTDRPRHRVVIVGGGFAGLYAAKQLGIDPEVALTVVDRRNFHLFQPMLYQVATGALSPGEIAQPLRSVLRKQRNTTVILGEAVGLDPERREVLLSDGGPIAYDTLIVAAGAHHTYFGRDDWARSRRGSRRSRTRPRSGGASSSPSRRPSARPIPSCARRG